MHVAWKFVSLTLPLPLTSFRLDRLFVEGTRCLTGRVQRTAGQVPGDGVRGRARTVS